MSTSEEDLKWYALYCQPNKERQVHDLLIASGFESFWPFVSQWVRTSQRGRSRLVRTSYFPRYTFARIRQDDLPSASSVRGVSYIVGVGGAAHAIPDWIMDRLRRTACPNGEIPQGEARKKRFKPGEMLKVVEESSPLVGLYLHFLNGSAIIRGEMTESGLKVQIPLEYVERADRSS